MDLCYYNIVDSANSESLFSTLESYASGATGKPWNGKWDGNGNGKQEGEFVQKAEMTQDSW